MGNYKCGKLYNLTLRDLTPNPDQPRKAFPDAEIHLLADSIKEKGLLQPILVKEKEDGQIIIVSGERRFRAHQLLELDTIPAWFTTGDAEELALVENLVREDLTAIETAEALKQLGSRLGDKPQADLAKLIGKAESTVSEIMSLNKLPQDIRDEIRGDNRYAVRELRKIASKRNVENQRILFKKYKDRLSGKTSKTRTLGPELHRKKIIEMEKYFVSMQETYKLAQLKPVYKELIQLGTTIDETINNLKKLCHIFDAPKIIPRNRPSEFADHNDGTES